VHKIETLANRAILKNMRVETAWLPRSEAENRYGFRLYQGGAVPGKEIRVVKTGNWDVEACAGTHLKSTGEIGFIKIIHSEKVQDGVERLVYSIGIPALKAVQTNERLLLKVSEILNAPPDKLDKTTERLVKELKGANIERRKLIKELAEREGASEETRVHEAVEEIDGIKLVKRDFREEIDVDRMVQTANKAVDRDSSAVAVFYGSDGKTGRIMIMAGSAALQRGVNAGEIAREASAVIGGGGGGRPNFGQGGGTEVGRLQQAVKKAESLLRKQLKN
jgi:alanyl-tRNA synthetase